MEEAFSYNNHKQLSTLTLLKWVEQNQILSSIKSQMHLIDSRIFPSFPYHNKAHAVKVALLAMILANPFQLDYSTKKILIDASLLHDIGRIDDIYDYDHNYIGATLIDSVLSNQTFYQDKTHLTLVQALIQGHNSNPYDHSVFIKYQHSLNQKNKLLLQILKEADSLERKRFPIASIDESKLQFNISHSLFHFVEDLNQSPFIKTFLEEGEMNEPTEYIKRN